MIDRLCLSVLLLAAAVASTVCAADAGLAAQYSPDLSGNFHQSNVLRSQVSLNGVWQVSLQSTIRPEVPAEGWGHVVVPSSWMHVNDFPIEGLAGFDMGKWNGAARVNGKPLGEYPSAWYRRRFTVPADWKDSRLALRFGRMSVSGTIFVNGKQVGVQNEWESKDWDITSLVKVGEPNDLLVRVDAMISGDVTLYLGAEQTRTVKASAYVRGITQDVTLLRTPTGVSVSDVFVKPSVRKGTLGIEVELANNDARRGNVRLRAVVTELNSDKPVKTFESPVFVLDGKATQVVDFTQPWTDARLWEQDDPYRYRIFVSLFQDDREIDRTVPVVFGFREVWVDGRNILLNGKSVHLRMVHSGPGDGFEHLAKPNFERYMAPYLKAGFNSLQFASEGVQRRGASAEFYDDAMEFADANGLLVAIPIASVMSVNWSQPEGRAEWEVATRTLMKRYRNRASLAMWSMNFNLLGYPWDLSPYAWGNGYTPSDRILNLGEKRERAAQSETIVRGFDDTRVIYHHAGGNYGQVMTSNFYPSFPADQEREDYPAAWAQQGAKPLITVEHGSPCFLDFLRGRVGDYESVRSTEMIEAEYASMRLGPAAFAGQADEYLKLISDNATSQKQNDADKYNVNQPYFWGYNMHLHEPVQSYFIAMYPEYMRGWRTYGVSGMCPHDIEPLLTGSRWEPWHGPADVHSYSDLTAPGAKPRSGFRPKSFETLSPLGEQMARAHAPVLAYFGGATGEGFSNKDHAFFTGENVSKQVVLVNDLRRDLDVVVKWRLVDVATGQAVVSGESPIQAKAGTVAFAPISCKAPAVATRTAFELQLEVPGVPAEKMATWSLPIEVWPKTSRPTFDSPVVIIDPANESSAMLDKMSIQHKPASDAAAVAAAKVIVIGREALKGSGSIPVDVIKAVRDGGATLVVFEQSNLSSFGLRTHARGVRRTFPLITGHPVVTGLTAADLANWRGDASLLEPHPQPRSDDTYPDEPFRYGNRGTVSAMMIEKPSAGGARPILECEYDLGYSPLMELREGRGRLIFCQLEVTRRYGVDPVATLIVDRLLSYAATPAGPAPAPVVTPGADKLLIDYLGQLGVVLEERVTDKTSVQVVDRMPEPSMQKSLQAFAQGDGTVILLGKQATTDLKWIGLTTSATPTTYYRAMPDAASPLMVGVSASDLFLKEELREVISSAGVQPLADPGFLSRVPAGKGQFVLCTIDPRTYAKNTTSPERMNRIHRKLSRTLGAIIANAGGAFRGLGEASVSSAGLADLPLPQEWKFSIDPKNEGSGKNWAEATFDDSAWQSIRVPGYWESQGINTVNPQFPDTKFQYDGFAWYRCRVTIPTKYKGANLSLLLGPVDDYDVTYLNGKKIGATSSSTPGAYEHPRDYVIPADTIKYDQENVVVVRAYDGLHRGGILGPDVKIRVRRNDSYPYLDASPSWNPYKLKRW